jgi:son of sevenless
MVAITSALSTLVVRELKQIWERVPTRFMRQLNACEAILDLSRNLSSHHRIVPGPPCVPYFGRMISIPCFSKYLTTVLQLQVFF